MVWRWRGDDWEIRITAKSEKRNTKIQGKEMKKKNRWMSTSTRSAVLDINYNICRFSMYINLKTICLVEIVVLIVMGHEIKLWIWDTDLTNCRMFVWENMLIWGGKNPHDKVFIALQRTANFSLNHSHFGSFMFALNKWLSDGTAASNTVLQEAGSKGSWV